MSETRGESPIFGWHEDLDRDVRTEAELSDITYAKVDQPLGRPAVVLDVGLPMRADEMNVARLRSLVIGVFDDGEDQQLLGGFLRGFDRIVDGSLPNIVPYHDHGENGVVVYPPWYAEVPHVED